MATTSQTKAAQYLLAHGWQWQAGFENREFDGALFLERHDCQVAINRDGLVEHEDISRTGALTPEQADQMLGTE